MVDKKTVSNFVQPSMSDIFFVYKNFLNFQFLFNIYFRLYNSKGTAKHSFYEQDAIGKSLENQKGKNFEKPYMSDITHE